MNRKKILLISGAVVLVLAGFLIILNIYSNAGDNGNVNLQTNIYESNRYDFSFEMPEGYDWLEVGDPSTGRHSIILSRSGDVEVPVNGEGPTAITVDIFEGAEVGSLEAWLVENNVSNYNLLIGESSEVAVDGAPAVVYRWDGLYLGRSVAFLHEGNVFLLSGTYLEPSDLIYGDFDRVVSSINLK